MSLTKSYPIPLTGLSNPYPTTGNTDWTVINPKPQQKDFFEFSQTFWNNMINVRNRQVATDGKTSGYPTLQSIYWKYLESGQAINIPNDNFTYQTMIDYVNAYDFSHNEDRIVATDDQNTYVLASGSTSKRVTIVIDNSQSISELKQEKITKIL